MVVNIMTVWSLLTAMEIFCLVWFTVFPWLVLELDLGISVCVSHCVCDTWAFILALSLSRESLVNPVCITKCSKLICHKENIYIPWNTIIIPRRWSISLIYSKKQNCDGIRVRVHWEYMEMQLLRWDFIFFHWTCTIHTCSKSILHDKYFSNS